jgi:hypothetical protein
MVNDVSTIKAGSTPTGGGYIRIPLSDITEPRPGRSSDQTLNASVKRFGVLQPVLVARTDHGYELLAGYRRLHAAREAGLADVPALIVPPDRAGSLDVYLEENLSRQDLSETDRMRLRDQWVRETGRDPELALGRIPEIRGEFDKNSTAKTSASKWWIYATGILAITTVGLLITTVAKKTTGVPLAETEDVVEIAEPVASSEPIPDITWMEAFSFPGSTRIVSGVNLTLEFTQPFFEKGQITPRGKLNLNQLAAIVQSSGTPLVIELVTKGTDPASELNLAASAASHLLQEGVSADRLLIKSGAAHTSNATLHFVVHP